MCTRRVRFWVNDRPILACHDDQAHGLLLGGGRIGFRQMPPTVARYANMRVYDAVD